MPDISSLGKILIVAGIAIAVIGVAVLVIGRIPGVGRLPGDIMVRRDGFSFYFPIVSCLILSIILTVVANVILRLIK